MQYETIGLIKIQAYCVYSSFINQICNLMKNKIRFIWLDVCSLKPDWWHSIVFLFFNSLSVESHVFFPMPRIAIYLTAQYLSRSFSCPFWKPEEQKHFFSLWYFPSFPRLINKINISGLKLSSDNYFKSFRCKLSRSAALKVFIHNRCCLTSSLVTNKLENASVSSFDLSISSNFFTNTENNYFLTLFWGIINYVSISIQSWLFTKARISLYIIVYCYIIVSYI